MTFGSRYLAPDVAKHTTICRWGSEMIGGPRWTCKRENPCPGNGIRTLDTGTIGLEVQRNSYG